MTNSAFSGTLINTMKLLLVVNPSASSVTARTRIVIQKALSADHRLEVAATSRRGHATRLAQSAANDNVDLVVVLGGDGTLNEVANGLAGTETALAALPGGSTNVFARTIGLPDDPVEATGSLLDALEAGSVRRIGLGVMNDRYFLFHAGIGFDAAVVEQVERQGGFLKRFAGHPLFVAATINTWLRHYNHKEPSFHISSSSEDVDIGMTETNGMFAVCLNTDPYTYLGSREISFSPETNLHTPLAVVTFQSLSPSRLLPVLSSALGLGNGHINDSPIIDYQVNVSEGSVSGYDPVPWQVDGDYLGKEKEFTFRHEAEALNLILPLGTRDIY